MLSNVTLKENSGRGVIIGNLKTIDPDNRNSKRQQFTYTFTSNPQGMLRIEINQLQVAIDGKKCQQYGGKYCKFNFEENRNIKIGIKVTDNGIPPNDFAKSFTIQILNQNDPPRNLRLTSNIVPENASIGYIIGQFLVDDEDDGQNHSFTLVSSDNQRFILDRDNNLRKAKSTNYETSKSHQIFVEVEDNGYPTMKVHCVKRIQIRSFFWFVFSRIWTEYGEIRSISPYSVRMRENTDQKKLRIWTLFPP